MLTYAPIISQLTHQSVVNCGHLACGSHLIQNTVGWSKTRFNRKHLSLSEWFIWSAAINSICIQIHLFYTTSSIYIQRQTDKRLIRGSSWLRINDLLASSFALTRTSDGSWCCTFDENPDSWCSLMVAVWMYSFSMQKKECLLYVWVTFTGFFKEEYWQKIRAQVNTDFSKNPLHSFSTIQSWNTYYWLFAVMVLAVFIMWQCCIIDVKDVVLTPKGLSYKLLKRVSV